MKEEPDEANMKIQILADDSDEDEGRMPPLPHVKLHSYCPIVEARKLEHGFGRIGARIPYILPLRHGDNDAPTF